MVTVFVSLIFAYLLICFIKFIEPLSDGYHGLNSTSCLWWALRAFPCISCLSAILNPVVAPGNKEIHFLLLWVHSIGFSINLIYSHYWIQLLPLATRILFPVKLWASSVSLILVLYSLYIYIQLLPLATSNPII